nr:DNA polymerase III subunit gamma/tau [Aeromonas dhakensis]
MSYQVLARKWRPHTFEQVVGQHHVLTALTNALDQGRLHHAYLLSGTRGVGKTTIARILAKSLNCEQGISSHPCGVCDTCREIDQGNFVDLLEIDAASRTKVEDTRELLDNVQYRPARGRFKVYLIDEVHMLSRHSFNALLKTLEEPPPYVKFLLATTDPQKLPITILSRCLQFHLKSLDQTQIAKQLEWVLDQEGQPFEPRALLALAKAADGSMRDALSLTDQALAHGNGSVRTDSVLAMLGTLDHRHLHQLLEAVLRQDAPATMAKITEIATLGPDFDQLHAELEGLLHRIAMAQLLPATVQEQGADADALLQLAQAMSPEEVQLCYQIVLGGRKDLPWAPDGRTALEMTCLRMLAFSPRREVLHPASLTALPPALGGLPAADARSTAPTLGKPEGVEPPPATGMMPQAPSTYAAISPAPVTSSALHQPSTKGRRRPDRPPSLTHRWLTWRSRKAAPSWIRCLPSRRSCCARPNRWAMRLRPSRSYPRLSLPQPSPRPPYKASPQRMWLTKWLTAGRGVSLQRWPACRACWASAICCEAACAASRAAMRRQPGRHRSSRWRPPNRHRWHRLRPCRPRRPTPRVPPGCRLLPRRSSQVTMSCRRSMPMKRAAATTKSI